MEPIAPSFWSALPVKSVDPRENSDMEPKAPFGPDYPKFGTRIARLRKSGDRREHGEAVLAAIRQMQRSALQRELPTIGTNCASGTVHREGKAILKAVRQQHERSLDRALIDANKKRTDDELCNAYAAAMAAKRNALKAAP